MNSNDILKAVVRQVFPPQRFSVCPNVTVLVDGESDLIAVTGADRIHEVEIKVSAADLRRDAKKSRWRDMTRAKTWTDYYWLAVPDFLLEEATARAREIGGAGVIKCATGGGEFVFAGKWIPAEKWKGPAPEDRARISYCINRLAMLRYWDLKFPRSA